VFAGFCVTTKRLSRNDIQSSTVAPLHLSAGSFTNMACRYVGLGLHPANSNETVYIDCQVYLMLIIFFVLDFIIDKVTNNTF
jgi:hypothetical protein